MLSECSMMHVVNTMHMITVLGNLAQQIPMRMNASFSYIGADPENSVDR